MTTEGKGEQGFVTLNETKKRWAESIETLERAIELDDPVLQEGLFQQALEFNPGLALYASEDEIDDVELIARERNCLLSFDPAEERGSGRIGIKKNTALTDGYSEGYSVLGSDFKR